MTTTPTNVLLVLLAGDVTRAREAICSESPNSEVEVLRLSDLPGAARRLLGRRYRRFAVAGTPPGEEIGYGVIPVVAALSRAREVLLIDLRDGGLHRVSSGRYLAGSLPFACMQLLVSGVAVGVQRATTRVMAAPSASASRARELRSVLYIRPSVGVPSPVGGSVTHSHEVIRALRDEGIHVDAVTTDAAIAEAAREDPEPPCRWRLAAIPRVLKALPASTGFGGDVALMRAALRAAQLSDVIYQRHARFSLVGALLARAARKPLFLEYNGSEEFMGRYWTPTPLKGQLAACERAAVGAAARIFVVSEIDREDLISRGVDPGRIILNPNGVAVERFAKGGGAEVRAKLRVSQTDLLVGFVGTFGPWHGASILARAFAAVAPELPEARLLLVGNGPELEMTRRQLAVSGVEKQAIFAGKVASNDVPAYLDACDVLVSPHVPLPDGVEFFGSPTKLFEYMAAGKGIIASDLGQIGEVLQHGQTAWLVPPGDEKALSSALHALAAAPRLREELGARARRRAAEHTWRKNARRIVEAYRALPAEPR